MNLVVFSVVKLRNVADGDIAHLHGEKDSSEGDIALCSNYRHHLAPRARAGSSAPADLES